MMKTTTKKNADVVRVKGLCCSKCGCPAFRPLSGSDVACVNCGLWVDVWGAC